MSDPLVSIIVPVYKTADVLPRCIDSLLCQTYQNLQIVLVDDGSPDNCGEICDQYAAQDCRIFVIHQTNGGLSAARNAGIDAASGQFFAFVDSDDYVEPDYIAFMLDLIEKYHADIASCGAINLQPSGKKIIVDSDKSAHVMDRREALERMCYNDGFYVTAWDKLYSARLFETIRYPCGKVFEDTGTTYKLVGLADKIVACCEPKYYYVTAPGSITTSGFAESKLDYVEMAEEMADYIVEKYPELKPAADRKCLHAYFSTLCQLVNSNTRRPDIEKQLSEKIRSVRGSVMKNLRASKRDKFAVVSLLLGRRFFAFAWRLYCKFGK